MSIFPRLLAVSATAGLLVVGCGGNGDTLSGSNSVGATTGASSGGAGPGGTGGGATTGAGGSGGTSTTTSATTGVGGAASTSSSSGTGGSGGFGTIFTILMENHDSSQVVDSVDAPYVNSLIAKYGLATNYKDSGSHPSLLNYLYLISGNTQFPFALGVDVQPTQLQFPKDVDNLGNQLEVAGVNWRSYQEDMVTPCNLDPTANALYEPKHDPFLYFTNIQSNAAVCANRNVDYSLFPADLAAGSYKYMWITPNMTDNGHNPIGDPVAALKQSDLWLSHEVPKILASDAYKNNGVLFITWDEGTGTFGTTDHVAMIVISPKLKSAGMKVATPLSHAGYLATVEEIFGLAKLGDAGAATSLMEFFTP